MSETELLLYEFPCNEKIRTYLRIESLFKRYDWFCQQTDPIAHQTAISALFELLDATARADLRNELLQGLDHQRQRLRTIKKATESDSLTLDRVNKALTAVADTVGRTAQSVRENQWLQIIRTRQTIAGGACEFDLPQLHHWLNLEISLRQKELESYVAPLDPIREASQLLLQFLRQNTEVKSYKANDGVFQLSMMNQPLPSLAQIWVHSQDNVIPEVSANKYMMWISFNRADADHKLHRIRGENIPFKMGICTL